MSRNLLGGLAFSILERIVVGETNSTLVLLCFVLCAFSILERIVVGETTVCSVTTMQEQIFQYPRTDRCG